MLCQFKIFYPLQACYKNARKKRAAKKRNRKTQADKHEILQKFMALPLLPPTLIKPAFNLLVAECRQRFGIYFDSFISYYEKEWINLITPEGMSVYGIKDRTNNYIESYHRTINGLCKKNPTPNNFIGKLFRKT